MIAELEGVDAVDNSHSLWSHIQTMYELDIFAEPDEAEEQDGVHVLTAHRSKGLEFDSVILFDMTEGSFPAGRKGEALTLPQHMTETPDNLSLAHYAEERRLCYVALTRARKNLIVTYSPNHGGKRMRKPSRFLYEAFGPDLDIQPLAGIGLPASIEKFGRGLNQSPGVTLAYPEVDGWIQLTPNQVSDYLMDPGMFYLRSVLKFPSRPHHRLTYGTALHAVFEVYFQERRKGKTAPLKRLLKVLEEHWK
jgi:DNA helicase-2/ATP-dependent DNA helicase PcrA